MEVVRPAGDGPPKRHRDTATIYKETPCDCHLYTIAVVKSECVWCVVVRESMG